MTQPSSLWPRVMLAAIVAALCWCPADAGAAPRFKQPATASSTDLLTDGLDDLLKPEPQSGAKPAPKFAPDQKLLNDLIENNLGEQQPGLNGGEDIGQEKEDPLKRIRENMGESSRLIDRQADAGETRDVQQQIITDLDELIKKMEKQCNCSGNSQCDNPSSSRQQSKRSQPKQAQGQKPKPSQQAGKKSGQPKQSQSTSAAQQSTARLDSASGEAAPGRSPEELMKEAWGHLPQRLREQMLQSSSDEFLPQYREEIENYFRRLAEEESGE